MLSETGSSELSAGDTGADDLRHYSVATKNPETRIAYRSMSNLAALVVYPFVMVTDNKLRQIMALGEQDRVFFRETEVGQVEATAYSKYPFAIHERI